MRLVELSLEEKTSKEVAPQERPEERIRCRGRLLSAL